MNDDELNLLIARSEEEQKIFHDIDRKRERDALEAWRSAGNRGKPPAPLMQLEELPAIYQMDELLDVKEADEVIEGRGQRKRNVVNYHDGLSDDAWAMVSTHTSFDAERNGLDNEAYSRLSKRVRTCRSCLNVQGRRKSVGPITSTLRRQRLP